MRCVSIEDTVLLLLFAALFFDDRYQVLEKVAPGTSMRANVTKTLMDQVMFAPFILSSKFLVNVSCLQISHVLHFRSVFRLYIIDGRKNCTAIKTSC